jgi:tetratricopeptide (TPR) repeat protein
VWAERFDRELHDLFALQDEVTEHLIGAIAPALGRAEEQRVRSRPPESLTAWELDQRATAFFNRLTKHDLEQARQLYREALRRDPGLAKSHTWLAASHFTDILMSWTPSPAQSLALIEEHARTAIHLDEDDAYAQTLLGVALTWKRQYNDARGSFEAAIRLNPSLTAAHAMYGNLLQFTGRPAEAIEMTKNAIRLSPRDPWMTFFIANLALSHILIGRYEDAVSFARQAISLVPTNVRAHQRLVAALAFTGQHEDAREALKVLLDLQPNLSLGYFDFAYPFSQPQERNRFLDGLRMAGWNP